MKQEEHSVTTEMLKFLQNNVYNVSDLTRKNKLTEILQKFVHPTEEVFIVENAKNKNAKAAMIDLKYFEDLLRYKEAVDRAIDQMVDKEAIDRLSEGNKEKLQLTDVLSDEDIDFDALNDEVHA